MDMFSDVNLSISYFLDEGVTGSLYRYYLNSSNDERFANNSRFLFNTKTVLCTRSEQDDRYLCHDYIFGLLTLLFVYLPSSRVLVCVYGPSTAAFLSNIWGDILLVAGAVIWLQVDSTAPAMADLVLGLTSWFLMLLGVGLIILGTSSETKGRPAAIGSVTNMFFKALCYPLLLVVAPLLNIVIKFQSFLWPTSKFIESQKKIVSLNESAFEALPQLSLQLYIVLHNMVSPSWVQLFSIISSSMTLSLPHILKFIENHNGPELETKEKLKHVAKYFLIFFLNSLFKISSTVIFFLFFDKFHLASILVYNVILYKFINFCGGYFNISNKKDFKIQMKESATMGFATTSNLENTQAAKRCRLLSFYYNLISYILALVSILIICYINFTDSTPKLALKYLPLMNVKWGELNIVKDITYCYIVLGSVIAVGLLSLIIDVIFWLILDDGIFHSSMNEKRGFNEEVDRKELDTNKTQVSESDNEVYLDNKFSEKNILKILKILFEDWSQDSPSNDDSSWKYMWTFLINTYFLLTG